MIDLYCERLDAGLWAEPVNAFTNMSFFIAAFASWHLASRHQSLSHGNYLLIGLMVAIGIGSSFFHTFATRWAQVLDILPILFFQIAFMWLYGRRVIHINHTWLASAVVLYIFAALYSRQFPQILNGSLIYAPAFILLLVLGTYNYVLASMERSILFIATGVFALSLFFRSIDIAVCVSFPFGTHFLWHLFNGMLVYLVFRALIKNTASVPGENA